MCGRAAGRSGIAAAVDGRGAGHGETERLVQLS